ncbi:T9SS type A sorting domain-containing protein [Paraflavitalea speifideaquila]|uniref:T9SS type A sorting domain-containing protein n=1 Tax=Paraflavitalea speifideaquila TaxID=3076558 RepID=UPI0028E69076|nr:T9SS type A sorting domain-containing protein [Paraflavitalea speifideiaquila]
MNRAQSFEIFPNPVADVLNVQLQTKAGRLVIQVVDANGKVVLKKELVTDGATLSTFINVQSLQPGVYYIQANEEKRKFIKL